MGPNHEKSFEKSLQELENITRQLEVGELPLKKALRLFEEGICLLDTCNRQLETAETRVEVLIGNRWKGIDAEGDRERGIESGD